MPTYPPLHRLALAVALAAAPALAFADGNPSADQIINSLKPGAGMLGSTRGIRPIGPAAEPAPPAQAPGAAPSSASVRPVAPRPSANPTAPPSVSLTVEFASNAAVLTPAAVRTLTTLGQALSSPALGADRFRIEGHTDTVGAPDTNKALSERRAQAVVTFLTTRFHLDPARLEAAGLGEDGLLVQTPPQTPEARNRRVQIVNLGT